MVLPVHLLILLVVGPNGRFTETSFKVMADHTVAVHTKSSILLIVKLLEWAIGLNGRTGQIVLNNVRMEFQKV